MCAILEPSGSSSFACSVIADSVQISALYLRGDPYEKSDAVFGVKKSLVIDLDKVDKKTADEYDVPEGIWLLKKDFVIITEKESLALRDEQAIKALKDQGLKMKLVDHLPVPDVD